MLVITVFFTAGGGVPATGLTLADIDLYLTSYEYATGTEAVIWNTERATQEIDDMGSYIKVYANEDLGRYAYFARGEYTGALALDTDNVTGVMGRELFPAGANEYTYTVTNSVTLAPVVGADVWVTSDLAGANVAWRGVTDAFGVALDVFDRKPWLDTGTWFFFTQSPGFTADAFPDIETVP
jgi:hypothetical protein